VLHELHVVQLPHVASTPDVSIEVGTGKVKVGEMREVDEYLPVLDIQALRVCKVKPDRGAYDSMRRRS